MNEDVFTWVIGGIAAAFCTLLLLLYHGFREIVKDLRQSLVDMNARLVTATTEIAMLKSRFTSELGHDGTLTRMEERINRQLSRFDRRLDAYFRKRDTTTLEDEDRDDGSDN